MKPNLCIIGVGSNIDPRENIPQAIELLKEKATVIATSTLIETKPIGNIYQPNFLNGAIKANTHLTQNKFNNFLKSIENRMGRDRTKGKYGPRNIDLDIVVWNGKIVDPDYHTRDFLKKSVDELR